MSSDLPDRARRLAEALRANLHRRKAQARAVAPDADTDPDDRMPVFRDREEGGAKGKRKGRSHRDSH